MGSLEQETKWAYGAIDQGVAPEVVAQKFKERNKRDLPALPIERIGWLRGEVNTVLARLPEDKRKELDVCCTIAADLYAGYPDD